MLDDFNPPGGQGWIAKTKSLVSNIASRLLGKKVSPNPAYDNVVVLENPGLKKPRVIFIITFRTPEITFQLQFVPMRLALMLNY